MNVVLWILGVLLACDLLYFIYVHVLFGQYYFYQAYERAIQNLIRQFLITVPLLISFLAALVLHLQGVRFSFSLRTLLVVRTLRRIDRDLLRRFGGRVTTGGAFR